MNLLMDEAGLESVEKVTGKEHKLFLSGSLNSIASIEHHERNEDAVFLDTERGVGIVCDGLGGHEGGREASNTARYLLEKRLTGISTQEKADIVKQKMEQAMVGASKMVVQISEMIEGKKRPGTTATTFKIVENDGERIAIVGHVGDSRGYLLRDGVLTQITEDDGFLPHDPASRKLDQVIYREDLDNLSDYERACFFQRNRLLQFLGSADQKGNVVDLNIHTYQIKLERGDKLILMSDGVTDNLTFDMLQELATNSDNNLAQAITYAAYEFSKEDIRDIKRLDDFEPQPTDNIRAKFDDISTVVVEVLPTPLAEKEVQINEDLNILTENVNRMLVNPEEGGFKVLKDVEKYLIENARSLKDSTQAKRLLDLYKLCNRSMSTESVVLRFSEGLDEAMEILHHTAKVDLPQRKDIWWFSKKSR